MEQQEQYMRRAMELAAYAASLGEVPVGAVIVRRSTGEIVGEGYNQRETAKHALAHAELMAIDAACRKLGGWRLLDCAMYVTLEPCTMCCGAIAQSRIEEIHFGAYDPNQGAVLSGSLRVHGQYHPQWEGGMLQTECSDLISLFFQRLRERRKAEKEQKRLAKTEEI